MAKKRPATATAVLSRDGELLRSAEAAAYIKCQPKALEHWRRLGKIDHVRVGERFIRYTKAGLDRFIEKHLQIGKAR
jgi:hypothetical protein